MDKRTAWRQHTDLLAQYLRPQGRRMTLLIGLFLTELVLRLANPQLVRHFLDSVATQGPLRQLLLVAGLFTFVAIAAEGLRLAVTYVAEQVAWTATNELRADLADHVLRLDLGFHKRHTPGELIERVDGDVNQLANFFSQLLVELGGNLLLVVGVLLLLWREHWLVGLSITAVSLCGVLVLNWLRRLTVPRWQAVRQTDARLFGYLEERLTGSEDIRSSGATDYALYRLYPLLGERLRRTLHAMRANIFVMSLPNFIFGLAYIAGHVLGYRYFLDGTLSIGSVYVVFYYVDVIRSPMWALTRQIEDLQRATASINRINELRAERPSIHNGPGVAVPDGPLGVHFDKVSFHYDDEPETAVLHHLDFRLEPGQVLGLLGRTGSGKSTLTRLLFRFYDPTAGAIRLLDHNGQAFDLRQATLSQVRRHVGLVTQDVQLFRASVRHNLTLFDDSIPDDQVWAVAEQVGLANWLAALADGLETKLETGTAGLSAGQAQLLAFARVFLANPGLVILDEASSRLDPATELWIERAIDELLANRTAIIVAHRLVTVQRADEIMILENGRIAEHGPRSALAQDHHSRFYHLLQVGLEGTDVKPFN
jgi:ATP-binding cassette, subfamily B, bacterial